jgi:tetratricopeptide (TPR) repeat protein
VLNPTDTDDRQLASTPVLVAAAVVVFALVVGAFLLGRSSGTTETAPVGPATPPAEVVVDPLSRALELHNAGQLDEALAAYQEILLNEPANQYALYNIGLINQTRGDNEVAIEYYDRALAADSTLTVAAYNRALALRDVGRLDESAEAFEALLLIDGENVGVLYNFGNLLISQGDVVRGTELVNRAIELDPSLRGD